MLSVCFTLFSYVLCPSRTCPALLDHISFLPYISAASNTLFLCHLFKSLLSFSLHYSQTASYVEHISTSLFTSEGKLKMQMVFIFNLVPHVTFLQWLMFCDACVCVLVHQIVHVRFGICRTTRRCWHWMVILTTSSACSTLKWQHWSTRCRRMSSKCGIHDVATSVSKR